MKNPVAKFSPRYNRSVKMVNRKREAKKEGYEEEEFDGLAVRYRRPRRR